MFTARPTDPDTDGDGLSDGEEVLTHGTDPEVGYRWRCSATALNRLWTDPLDLE